MNEGGFSLSRSLSLNFNSRRERKDPTHQFRKIKFLNKVQFSLRGRATFLRFLGDSCRAEVLPERVSRPARPLVIADLLQFGRKKSARSTEREKKKFTVQLKREKSRKVIKRFRALSLLTACTAAAHRYFYFRLQSLPFTRRLGSFLSHLLQIYPVTL